MGSGLIPAEVIQYVDLVLGLCYQRNLVKLLAALPCQLCLGVSALTSLSLLAHLLRGNGTRVCLPAYPLPAVCPQVDHLSSLGSHFLIS